MLRRCTVAATRNRRPAVGVCAQRPAERCATGSSPVRRTGAMSPRALVDLAPDAPSGVRLILVVVITAVIVAACGSSASTAFRDGGPANAPGPVTAATAAPSAAAAPGVPVQDGSGEAGPGSNGNDAPGDNGPLVVKTGSVVARGQGRRRSRAPCPRPDRRPGRLCQRLRARQSRRRRVRADHVPHSCLSVG